MIHVIGSINLDLIATTPRLPLPGETLAGGTFTTAPGGKGANQALAACRAGSRVALTGAVGRDAFAGEALALLESGGVDLTGVARADAATGIALILVGGDGENVIVVIPGANALVSPFVVEDLQIAARDAVVLQFEIPLETVAAALKASRKAGALSILNTAPFRPEAASLLGQADIVVANETEFDLYAEALALKGKDRQARMTAFTTATGRTMIVTLGGDGVLAATPDGGLFTVPALKITPVDTVGAGDTFCGYLAAALDAGEPLKAALKRAAAAASLACLKPGAQPAIPMKAELDAAL